MHHGKGNEILCTSGNLKLLSLELNFKVNVHLAGGRMILIYPYCLVQNNIFYFRFEMLNNDSIPYESH